MLGMVGLFVPIVREMKEMAYEFEEPYIVDDSQFRQTFSAETRPFPQPWTIQWLPGFSVRSQQPAR